MHWSATVSDTVTDFQDLWTPPSHKHLYSTVPDAIADFKESLVPNKFRPVSTSMDPLSSMHQSATASGALADFQESLVPDNYLVITSWLSRYYELIISLLQVSFLVITR